MGATGTPTEIPSGKTVLLAGGGLGNAVLFSIGKAMRAAGNRVIYFAGYRERTACSRPRRSRPPRTSSSGPSIARPGAALAASRPQDFSCVGNILDAIEAYAKGELGARDPAR